MKNGRTVFLYYHYMESVICEIRDNARLDGIRTADLYFELMLPLSKPVTTAIILFGSIWIWNDFLLPLLMVNSRSDTRTITIVLYSYVRQQSECWRCGMAVIGLGALPMVVFTYDWTNKMLRICKGYVKLKQ